MEKQPVCMDRMVYCEKDVVYTQIDDKISSHQNIISFLNGIWPSDTKISMKE